MFNDERVLSQALFNSNKKSKIEERSALSTHLKPLCVQKFTVARRLEIREILLMTLQSRCINVIGPCGIGKTMVLKRVAQYAYERRIFKDGVVYLDFLTTTDIIFLYRYIANTLNLPYFNNTRDLCVAINNLDILLIIDNIDLLIKQDEASLIECYDDILLNTIRPKFLIASRVPLNLQRSKTYSMPDLSILQAITLLKQLNSDQKLKNISAKIFERIGTKPSDILQISPIFFQENYENLIENEKIQEIDDKSLCSLSVSLKFINDKFPDSQNFFKILGYLPSGALKINIKYLCDELLINYEEILVMLKSKGT